LRFESNEQTFLVVLNFNHGLIRASSPPGATGTDGQSAAHYVLRYTGHLNGGLFPETAASALLNWLMCSSLPVSEDEDENWWTAVHLAILGKNLDIKDLQLQAIEVLNDFVNGSRRISRLDRSTFITLFLNNCTPDELLGSIAMRVMSQSPLRGLLAKSPPIRRGPGCALVGHGSWLWAVFAAYAAFRSETEAEARMKTVTDSTPPKVNDSPLNVTFNVNNTLTITDSPINGSPDTPLESATFPSYSVNIVTGRHKSTSGDSIKVESQATGCDCRSRVDMQTTEIPVPVLPDHALSNTVSGSNIVINTYH